MTVVRELSATACLSGDPEKLKQVVLNLVMNALEAMQERRDAVGARRPSTAIRSCSWSPTRGPGSSRRALAQVFDPFFTTKEAGTGLGLSIVRKIVDQHAGEVRIESERGVGTRVTVVLPDANSKWTATPPLAR